MGNLHCLAHDKSFEQVTMFKSNSGIGIFYLYYWFCLLATNKMVQVGSMHLTTKNAKQKHWEVYDQVPRWEI